MKRCFLFPGQGAQHVGMGKDLFEEHAEVREIFEIASDRAGFDLAELVFRGTEDDLKATDRSQVAITAVNLGARRVLAARGIESVAAAGFSLGEYAALVDGGILEEADALALVVERGRIMESVSRSLDSADGSPGMAAVLGIDVDAIEQALAGAGIGDVYPANLNSPVQTVLSGTAAGLEAAAPVLKEAGARRFVPLKVSGPFHSPLMEPAREQFSVVLADVTLDRRGSAHRSGRVRRAARSRARRGAERSLARLPEGARRGHGTLSSGGHARPHGNTDRISRLISSER